MENINMVKHNYFYLIFICLFGVNTYAQKVSNITFKQEQSNIVVSYDLESKTACKVSLYVSTNGGATWQGPLTKVTGDVGNKITSGSHSIIWNVLEEFEELRGDEIIFQVRTAVDNIETVIIGNQEWTTKNLNVSKYRNGDEIPEVQDPNQWSSLTSGAWVYCSNEPKNGLVYGKLYNWYAVNDPRGLAPDGYHIANNDEWYEMIVEVKKKYTGKKGLKNKSKIEDLKLLYGGSSFMGANGTNSFTSYLYGIYSQGIWWTSSESDKKNAASYDLDYIINPFGDDVVHISCSKTNFFSVRCLKD